MKTIKEYINESLFDSEDKLLNKKPLEVSLNWLRDKNNVKFYPPEPELYISDKGIAIKSKRKIDATWLQAPAADLKLDRESWEDVAINIIKFNIIDANSLDSVKGPIKEIDNNKELKNINIQVPADNGISFASKNPKALSLFLPDTELFNKVLITPYKNIKSYDQFSLRIPRVNLGTYYDLANILRIEYAPSIKNISIYLGKCANIQDIYKFHNEYFDQLIQKGIYKLEFFETKIKESCVMVFIDNKVNTKGEYDWAGEKFEESHRTTNSKKGRWALYNKANNRYINGVLD